MLEATEDVGRRVLVAARAGGAVLLLGDHDVAHALEQTFDADVALGPRERRTRTRVHTVPERDVLPGVRAIQPELLGRLEAARVTVRGAVEHHYGRARRDVDTTDRRRHAGQAEVTLD